MPAIETLKIKGFKAFPNEFELKFNGNHLLMYGENGSGKSSIYYALHCMFHSIRKPDNGKKYFNLYDENGNSNHQHLLNINSADNDSKIQLIFENDPWVYTLDEGGFSPVSSGATAPFDTDGVFINHQFLFSFFNFTNSKTVNLFQIFQREMLPYIYDNEHSIFVSQMYDSIVTAASHLGNKASTKNINFSIDILNNCISKTVDEINLRATDIYNEKLKAAEDTDLKIKLKFLKDNDQPDILLNGYRLRFDYPLIVDHTGHLIKARNKRLNEPIISLEIYEGISNKPISKPQSYFNEAKLTAIALSIRFALLNLDKPADGRFLALDDMLISLDMSNRTNVINFLLEIADKYKIYLFTHDLNFYDLVKRKIEKEHKAGNEWLIGKIYMNDFVNPQVPEFIQDRNIIERAEQYLMKHDYPACGIHLRRECESILDTLLPETLKTKTTSVDGNYKTEPLNLNDKILNLEPFCKKESIDYNKLKSLKIYKDVILNTLAHNDSQSPIFKSELLALIEALKILKSIERNQVILKSCKDASIKFNIEGKDIAICFRTRENMLLLENAGVPTISNFGKCEVTKIKEDGVDKEATGVYDSLFDIYKYFCGEYGKEPTDNLLDITDYRGERLRLKLNIAIPTILSAL